MPRVAKSETRTARPYPSLPSYCISILWPALVACGGVATPVQFEHGVSPSAGPGHPTDVLTQHNDPQRTGASLHESNLNPDSVRSGHFKRLFDWEVNGQIYAQPLYLSAVPYQGRWINMVIVATMENDLYAFEAPAIGSDIQPSPKPLWKIGPEVFGEPLRYDYFSMEWGILGHNIKPRIGITSTPVIDRELGTVFITAKSGSGGFLGLFKHAVNRLFAIDLITGRPKAEVEVTATYAGQDGSESMLDAKYHLQRAGLLEKNGQIYLGFGSHQDTNPYHGWVVAYSASDLHQTHVFCTTCGHASDSSMGGIWQAGGGPAADDQGNVYVMAGNGHYDPKNGDFGSSFIKLDKDLRVVGSWTPANHDCLRRTDTDLGSAGPLFLSESSTLVGGGKEGMMFALQPSALQGVHEGTGKPSGLHYPCYDSRDPWPDAAGPGYVSIQAAPPWESSGLMDFLRHFDVDVLSQGFHHIHGAPAKWVVSTPAGESTLVYVSAERDLLRTYRLSSNGAFADAAAPGEPPTDTFHSACPNSKYGMPGGFLTISADE